MQCEALPTIEGSLTEVSEKRKGCGRKAIPPAFARILSGDSTSPLTREAKNSAVFWKGWFWARLANDKNIKKRSQHITVTAFIDYCFVQLPPFCRPLKIYCVIKGGIWGGTLPQAEFEVPHRHQPSYSENLGALAITSASRACGNCS